MKFEHTLSSIHHILKGKPHYSSAEAGDVWVLDRAERDAVLHQFNQVTAFRRKLARKARATADKAVCGRHCDRLAHALEEALAEIAYWLPDYLEGGSDFEHPRGSGPDRVTKLGRAALDHRG